MDQIDQNKKQKNNYVKGWFCTWPKCPIKKEDVLTILETNKLPAEIVEYVICEEEHKDGSPHLHAFLKMSRRIRFNQIKTKFDLLDYHGHYEPANSWRAVADYCKKEGNYISNINIEAAKKKQSKKIQYTDFERDPIELLEEGILHPLSLNNFLKNRSLYLGLKREKEEKNTNWEFLVKRRHQWVFGPSNTGKTTAMRKWINCVGEENCCEIPYNNDWTRYNGQKYLYADEYKGQLTIQELNRICDGGCWVNTKGSSAKLRKDVELKIFSNYSIRDTYAKVDDSLLNTLYNRFDEVDVINEKLNNN